MNRRALLALVGSSAVAGCSTLADLTPQSPVGLAGIEVTNYDTEPHRVTVQVQARDGLVAEHELRTEGRDGEVVHGTSVPCTWTESDGPYRVRIRYADSAGWDSIDLDEAIDTDDAVVLMVRVGDDRAEGGVSFWVGSGEREGCREED